jgi:tRNA (cmo5U34)-methyltransferase
MPKFSFATEEGGFDKHIRLSIRGYTDLWDDILRFSDYFVEDGTTIIDIGCSTGRLLKAMKMLNNDHAPNSVYMGIELEEDFFPELIDEDNLKFQLQDVRNFDWLSEAPRCSLITSIFSLQFISKMDRQKIICQIYNALITGGAFILAEKILSAHSMIEEMMTFCYYDWKRQNFDEKQILEKERQLRHMMKLMTREQVTSMLTDAGFASVQPFWQNFNFVGWIALKS